MAFITCQHMYKKYPGTDWIFYNAGLSIEQGQFLFVLGNSGSGKTTFIKILCGQEGYDRGRIFVKNRNFRNIRRKHLHLWRRTLGVVFQDFRLLEDRTVKENIALPLVITGFGKKEVIDRVNAVLKLVDLQHRADVPCKLLSGGEQQRVAIGRAIVHGPELILADEPTGSLDDDHTRRILQLFTTLHRRGLTVVIATHDRRLPLAVKGCRTVMIRDKNFVDVVPVKRANK
ncbi:MAG: ATP-binding cassette domain-containing protein [Deltaproteobacteria bacterium]|nr:ATP-binding cassette domain-containing protein [Deltaproteobacteria bacterium]MBW2068655.1 ATP-binding cassette domain-containing protein [Deltaproteobacteria bacterium]